MNIVSYYELRKISPEKAREVIRKALEANNRNVSKTAKILEISSHTVRRVINGSVADKSQKHKIWLRKTSTDLENLIIHKAQRTGFRHKRLSLYLLRKYGIKIL